MTYALSAATRTQLGRQSKQVFEEGSIPAVVYGHGTAPRSLTIKASEFRSVYRGAGTSSLVDVSIDGGSPVKAVIKEVQVHPVRMHPIHVDFHEVRMDEEMSAEVPLKFVGESKAVKEAAGTLVQAMTSIVVKCLPGNLPHEITVDISALATFDDVITVGSLKLPAGVTVDTDPGMAVVSVSAPLTEEQLKKMEEASNMDVSAIKTEAEEKRAAEEAKKAEEAAADAK